MKTIARRLLNYEQNYERRLKNAGRRGKSLF